jgi:transglutaminase-like putative cysteine protease
MNHRLTIAAAVAVIAASTTEWVLIQGAGWLSASIGAVIVVALAGTLTRLVPLRAAIGAAVLTAGACAPLLADRSLYLKAVGLVLIACCAASATRARFLRPISDALTYLAVLLLYLNLTLSRGKSYAALIPTTKSLHHLVTLANQGMAAAKQPPPVTSSAGVVLLAAASIGLAAIVVDIIAIRMHQPAIAGLPLLVIYMAPIATAAKISGISSVITFLLAASGYLAMLASDGRSRLRGWGKIVTVWHYAGEDERLGGADIRGLAATGRRIGFAAVCAAIVAPLLLPSLNLHRLFASHSGGTGTGATGLPLPLDQLHNLLTSTSNAPVLSYHSAGSNPGEYLQVYVLNYSSGKGVWTLIPPSPSIGIGTTPLHPPQGLSPKVAVGDTTTTIKLDHVTGSAGFSFPVFFLPVPYWPERLSLGGAWSAASNTDMIFSGEANHSGMTYTVTSGQAEITPAEEAASTPVPAAISRQYLGFKSPVTSKLLSIAQEVTAGATSPFAKARALEAYFQSGGFTYTLKAADLPNTPKGLLTFLTTDKQGFCEQFAFAMAVLARLEGIPSRIAIGYTPGTKTGDGTWQVKSADAHAWPELYFSGLGWTRFEPTPGGPHGQGTAQQPSYAIPSGGGQTGPSGHTSTIKPTKPGAGKAAINSHVRPPGTGSGKVGPVGSLPLPKVSTPLPAEQIALTLLALLLLAGAAPGVARVIVRRRRWRSAIDDSSLANAAWQEICANLDDFGYAHRASESPRATARRITADSEIDESARQAIGRIALVVERCRYAPEPATAEGIRADVTQVRRSLARSTTRRRRLQARLLPASTIVPFSDAVRQRLGQATGWVPTLNEA